MQNINEQMDLFHKLLDMCEAHFGPTCEIVLHDLTLEYDRTIVDIRNGHITGRKAGDCGSNLGLEVLRGSVKNGDRYNYITQTKDGKILRSSSLYIKDGDNQVIGSICINSDITEAVRFKDHLDAAINYPNGNENEKKEVFANDVNQLLDYFLQEGQRLVGKTAPLMNKEERLQFLKYLDDKGAFLITKSGEKICDFLNISKFTLYNDLDTIRKECEKLATYSMSIS